MNPRIYPDLSNMIYDAFIKNTTVEILMYDLEPHKEHYVHDFGKVESEKIEEIYNTLSPVFKTIGKLKFNNFRCSITPNETQYKSQKKELLLTIIRIESGGENCFWSECMVIYSSPTREIILGRQE